MSKGTVSDDFDLIEVSDAELTLERARANSQLASLSALSALSALSQLSTPSALSVTAGS